MRALPSTGTTVRRCAESLAGPLAAIQTVAAGRGGPMTTGFAVETRTCQRRRPRRLPMRSNGGEAAEAREPRPAESNVIQMYATARSPWPRTSPSRGHSASPGKKVPAGPLLPMQTTEPESLRTSRRFQRQFRGRHSSRSAVRRPGGSCRRLRKESVRLERPGQRGDRIARRLRRRQAPTG